jgi:hypothetical protein
MSGVKGKSGGSNALPCRWNGMDFSSLRDIDDYLGRTRGTSRYYFKNNKPFFGHKIYLGNESKNLKYSESELIEFYSFVNARRSILPDIGLKKMVELFNDR